MSRLRKALWLVLAAGISACTPADDAVMGRPEALAAPAANRIDGPRFSAGPGGEIVMSWMEPVDGGTSLLFAPLEDDGFVAPRSVVTEDRMFVNWADMPSVMHVDGDYWIAHWLRYSAEKTYAYDVVVSQSFDGGATWHEGVPAHTDGTPTEHGFVSMHRAADGVALLWLDGRETPEAPMTLRSAVVTPDSSLVREQLVDDSVCDCCQTDVAVADGGPVAVYRDRTAEEVRDIYVTRQVDGAWLPGVPLYGDNWVIPGCPVNGPSIVARDNQVAVAWFSAANGAPVVRAITSQDNGATFGEPVQIAAGKLLGYVGLAMLGDGSLAVSWVERDTTGVNSVNLRHVSASGIPGPVQTIGTTGQLRVFPQLQYRQGNLYAAWTDETDDGRYLEAVRIPVSLP